jgi:dimethylargininase
VHTGKLSYGPRLNADPTAALRAALIVQPGKAIEEARPLPGEPSAVHTRAIHEQNILIKTLMQFGCDVTLLDAHTDDPFASAVADTAIVFENGAVMLRPSSMRRRPESAWLEREFEKRDFPIAGHLAAPGLLDGSDVLMAGHTAFIGVSPRSNSLGRSGFAQVARAHGFDPVEVPLAAGVRSLRSVAGVISANTIVTAGERYLDIRAFSGFKTLTVPAGDQLGAGVLNLGEHHVLADVRFPRANEVMRKSGVTVEAIDLYDYSRVGLTPSMLVLDLKRS